MVQKRAVLNKNRPVSATFGSVFTRTGAFWNETEHLVKRITPDIELEMRVVKESSDIPRQKMGVQRQKSGWFWKKRVFVEKTIFVIERIIGVKVGGNWLRLG
ncbi:MAG: hypothetical protein ACYTEX_17945 [Planctomycetota bacterium]|jgi:hypothetical protein